MVQELKRNPTRAVRIGRVTIGAGHPIAVQSMTATHTQDVDATVQQVEALQAAGADVVRIAVDSKADAAGTGGDPPADRRQSVGRPAGELSPGRTRRAARRQAALQPRASVSPRAGEALAGQGALPGRDGGRRTIVRSAWASIAAASIRRRRISIRPTTRSPRCSKVRWSTVRCWIRSDFTRYCVSLEGLRSAEGDRSQSSVCRAASGRPSAPGSHRGGNAAGRNYQDANRLRATDQPRASATRFASR